MPNPLTLLELWHHLPSIQWCLCRGLSRSITLNHCPLPESVGKEVLWPKVQHRCRRATCRSGSQAFTCHRVMKWETSKTPNTKQLLHCALLSCTINIPLLSYLKWVENCKMFKSRWFGVRSLGRASPFLSLISTAFAKSSTKGEKTRDESMMLLNLQDKYIIWNWVWHLYG